MSEEDSTAARLLVFDCLCCNLGDGGMKRDHYSTNTNSGESPEGFSILQSCIM